MNLTKSLTRLMKYVIVHNVSMVKSEVSLNPETINDVDEYDRSALDKAIHRALHSVDMNDNERLRDYMDIIIFLRDNGALVNYNDGPGCVWGNVLDKGHNQILQQVVGNDTVPEKYRHRIRQIAFSSRNKQLLSMVERMEKKQELIAI